MQKVEGSNPFSRSRKGLHLQVFFVAQSAGAVASAGSHWVVGGQPPQREPSESGEFAGVCGPLEPLTFCGGTRHGLASQVSVGSREVADDCATPSGVAGGRLQSTAFAHEESRWEHGSTRSRRSVESTRERHSTLSAILVSMAEAVRIPVSPDARLPTRRTLDERLFVRWPGAFAPLARAVNRLPPRSRLRRALLRRDVRAAFAAWNRKDLEAVVARLHPQIVYHPRADEPDPSPHVGRDAYERLAYGFIDSFSEVTVEVLELIDAGDHVIASTVLHGVLRRQESASGAGVSDTYVFVYKLRDGLVVECWEYRTKQEALEAVGLSEQDAYADS
jgi:ketosteroid isomerase-like protein